MGIRTVDNFLTVIAALMMMIYKKWVNKIKTVSWFYCVIYYGSVFGVLMSRLELMNLYADSKTDRDAFRNAGSTTVMFQSLNAGFVLFLQQLLLRIGLST
jgi:dipeptide/tripeptide permease